MVAAPDYHKILNKNLLGLSLSLTAVAAMGLTFHFHGHSTQVPEASSQFGFWALAPIGVIDRIYTLFTGMRLIWDPVPMFLVLWTFYFALSELLIKFLWFRGPMSEQVDQ